MKIELPVSEALLIKRYKRFLADVELADGSELTVHCPNPGSMLGCKQPGSRVILRDSRNPTRKLRYTFQSIDVDGSWVNVDTSLANGLVAEAIEAGRIPELAGYDELRREVRYGEKSRLDILLEHGTERCWVEVKSTTLCETGTAMFPDAVTLRGKKHLEELERIVAEGQRGVIFFLVNRSDAQSFTPADEIDPDYGRVLRRAVRAGVEALAYDTRVEPDRFELGERLPIEL